MCPSEQKEKFNSSWIVTLPYSDSLLRCKCPGRIFLMSSLMRPLEICWAELSWNASDIRHTSYIETLWCIALMRID